MSVAATPLEQAFEAVVLAPAPIPRRSSVFAIAPAVTRPLVPLMQPSGREI